MNQARPITVVVAEDEFLVAKEIERAVKAAGLVPVGNASDGRQAVDLVCELRPDVALLDIQMPGIDGLEAARQIQQRCPTPVVILTAHESLELAERASQVGVGAYLTKPPKAEQIARAVAIARARFQDLQRLRELTTQLEQQNQELRAALDRVETLEGMLPICAKCKRIRDQNGDWIDVARYVGDRSRAEFTHGICPVCAKELYGDLG